MCSAVIFSTFFLFLDQRFCSNLLAIELFRIQLNLSVHRLGFHSSKEIWIESQWIARKAKKWSIHTKKYPPMKLNWKHISCNMPAFVAAVQRKTVENWLKFFCFVSSLMLDMSFAFMFFVEFHSRHSHSTVFSLFWLNRRPEIPLCFFFCWLLYSFIRLVVECFVSGRFFRCSTRIFFTLGRMQLQNFPKILCVTPGVGNIEANDWMCHEYWCNKR